MYPNGGRESSESDPVSERAVAQILSLMEHGIVGSRRDDNSGKDISDVIRIAMGRPSGVETCPRLYDQPSVSRWVGALTAEIGRLHWTSDLARARGMRRLAIAQLGSESMGPGAGVQYLRCAARLLVNWGATLVIRHTVDRLDDEVSWWRRVLWRDDVEIRDRMDEAACDCDEFSGDLHEWHRPNLSVPGVPLAVRRADGVLSMIHGVLITAAYEVQNIPQRVVRNVAYVADAISDAVGVDAERRDEVLSEFAENLVILLWEMGSPGVHYLWMTPEQPVSVDLDLSSGLRFDARVMHSNVVVPITRAIRRSQSKGDHHE